MPSGIIHTKASLLTSIPCFAAGYLVSQDLLSATACFGGCLLGILITPDLDQESISTSEYKLVKWTLGLGYFWTMLWFPYALMFKHRSFFSHFPIVSTLLRIGYICVFLGFFHSLGMSFPQPSWTVMLWTVIGLMVSDTLHWFMDLVSGATHAKSY